MAYPLFNGLSVMVEGFVKPPRNGIDTLHLKAVVKGN
jgi:hypothetical protein